MDKDVIGAKVIATTSSPEKAAKATALGADVVINYKGRRHPGAGA